MKHLVILFCEKIFLYYQYLYPIVRIDEQSKNVRIDEHFFKNLIKTEKIIFCA